MDDLTKLKLQKLQKLEEEIELKESLPFLHAFKDYPWSEEFISDTTKLTVLTAANQIGKSTTLQRKIIKWATHPELWPSLWPDLHKIKQKPTQFWYLYPTRDIATAEFFDKWVRLLPQGKYKDHPQFGWKASIQHKMIWYIDFNTGVRLYFKSYAQELIALQAGTVAIIGCDEEVDAHLVDELMMRINATNGYMSFVFTATQGQQFWREVVEDRTRLKEAKVWQISLYDCQKYVDGTLSPWTDEKIDTIIGRCKDDAEIQRRVFGKFVIDSGRKYPFFDRSKLLVDPFPIPNDWSRYAGVDWGSGGKSGHPSAICFIAVNPTYTYGVVYKFWRGDNIETTAEDVINKTIEMKGDDNLVMVSYDYSAKDLFTIAERVGGLPMAKAVKDRNSGESIIGTLTKNGMLKFFKDDPEISKLVLEFETVMENTAKTKAKDDGIDATRYCAYPIPWAFEKVIKGLPKAKEPIKQVTPPEKLRPGEEFIKKNITNLYDQEIEEWNDLY